jgi:uncharacterized protein (TIGR03437 family)
MKLKVLNYFLFAAFLPASLIGQVVLNSTPTREVGQATLPVKTAAPNLVEGKELYSPEGIAVDTSTSPPILYVSDTLNGRVLAWKNASQFANGQPADLVIGQPDPYSTPIAGTSFNPLSLYSPSGLAVDGSGNLFVADSAMNRILRYPAPFRQNQSPAADIVFGQPSMNTSAGNLGGTPSASTLNLNGNVASLAFDAQGDLWVADAGNNRVLRYPAAAVAGAKSGAAADLVLGQPDFATTTAANSILNLAGLRTPAGVAFDSEGHLFVSDVIDRVLVFVPPLVTGMTAKRLMAGLGVLQPGGSTPTDQNLNVPQGVFTVGNVPFVVDTFDHRILRYDPYDKWPTTVLQFSGSQAPPYPILTPPIANTTPMGQNSFVTKTANMGLAEPSAATLDAPTQAVFAAGELFVADSGNNRVLVFGDPTLGPPFTAVGVLGQLDFPYCAPNLIEGRELFIRSGNFGGGGLAVDATSNPPHLYIADTLNNRVLGYNDVRTVTVGAKADIVIGQPDFWRAVPNYPSGNLSSSGNVAVLTPTSSSLTSPTSVAVDSSGNLWVADYGNGRVLRFPQPFNQGQTAGLAANLVIGQPNFTSATLAASQQFMSGPFGLAFSVSGNLYVADATNNRVLLFAQPFANGMPASNVIGQPDYTTTQRKDVTDRKLAGPGALATDSLDNLYVCDVGNGRVAIYYDAIGASIDPEPTAPLTGLSNPYGIVVNQTTGAIWVANTGGGQVLQYPDYNDLPTTNFKPYSPPITSNGPLSPALDTFGNLLVSESVNRVALYYPSMAAVTNAANYQQRAIAPGEIVTLWSNGLFADSTQSFGSVIPVPTTIADTQVLVNGQPAPLFFISPGQVNFVVPIDLPTSGTVDLQVFQPSQSRIRAVSTMQAAAASPALFTADGSGLGQLAAINEDGTVNGQGNPVQRGHYISLYGTGEGFVAGAPPDGQPAPGAVPTNVNPVVYIDGVLESSSSLGQYFYSGLAPGLVGVWQINLQIPTSVPPGAAIPVVLQYQSIFTGGQGQATTIAVKQ